jgi:hypothetical protein
VDDAFSNLAPHRPLEGGSVQYAQRPEGSGTELAAAVRAGWRRIAVVGPMGVGKSTELAAAMGPLLGPRSRIQRIAVDHSFDMRRIQAGAVFAHILATFRGRQPDSAQFEADIAGATRELRRDLARKELRAAGEVALFVDGLEKAEEAAARAVVEELFALGDDADIVLVVPISLAYGPGAVIPNEDVRPFFVRPVRVWGASVAQGKAFLREVALRHLGVRQAEAEAGSPLGELVELASVASGGVPRVLLQLLRDAHRHHIVAQSPFIQTADFKQAERDHGEQLRRSLLAGDVDALTKAEGQDGNEVPFERKLRLMLHGHLLEYKIGDRIVMHMAPTLALALRFPQALG